MIALDTNFLLPLLIDSHPQYPLVSKWFLAQDGQWALTHVNVAEFLRLITHPKVFSHSLSIKKASEILDIFVSDFKVSVMESQDGWWKELEGLSKQISKLGGNNIFDAQIALTLRHHGVKEICTFDEGFQNFSFLKIRKIS